MEDRKPRESRFGTENPEARLAHLREQAPTLGSNRRLRLYAVFGSILMLLTVAAFYFAMQIYKATELELKARVLGPMGAIVATTRTNAELLNRSNDLGTIETGKLADLIVVNGDPLADIKVLQQYEENITLIMKGGWLYKNKL